MDSFDWSVSSKEFAAGSFGSVDPSGKSGLELRHFFRHLAKFSTNRPNISAEHTDLEALMPGACVSVIVRELDFRENLAFTGTLTASPAGRGEQHE